jgi:hypothetical protein
MIRATREELNKAAKDWLSIARHNIRVSGVRIKRAHGVLSERGTYPQKGWTTTCLQTALHYVSDARARLDIAAAFLQVLEDVKFGKKPIEVLRVQWDAHANESAELEDTIKEELRGQ